MIENLSATRDSVLGEAGRVTVKERGTVERVPSTKSKSVGTSGRSEVVRKGEPRTVPNRPLKCGLDADEEPEGLSVSTGTIDDGEDCWERARRRRVLLDVCPAGEERLDNIERCRVLLFQTRVNQTVPVNHLHSWHLHPHHKPCVVCTHQCFVHLVRSARIIFVTTLHDGQNNHSVI